MSCMFCINWAVDVRDDKRKELPFDQRKGHCTLHPVWIDARADHFCGQFREEAHASEAGGSFRLLAWRDSRRSYELLRDERSRCIKLEKELKALRAKLRASKVKQIEHKPE